MAAGSASRPLYLVFDVGGTFIRGSLYDPAVNQLVREASLRTFSTWADPNASHTYLIKQLLESVSSLARILAAPDPPDLIAISFPGPIDSMGRALAIPTIVGATLREPLSIVGLFGQLWPRDRIIVLNDVTAAGFALRQRMEEDFCVVTVSSGIGSKVFVDGRPLIGSYGRGGEIGHVVVDQAPSANLCECGGRGHLSAISSGRGVAMTARRKARLDPTSYRRSLMAKLDYETLDAPVIVEAFHAGDQWAEEVISEAAAILGCALAHVHTMVGVERLVLIGGFAVALGDRYRRLVAAGGSASCWNLGQDWNAMVELSDLEGRACMLGAGRYARLVTAMEKR
ncbi:MAG: ROK family protein [Pseudonocardiaceae bacterium]